MTEKAIREASIDTKLLYKRLSEAQIGDLVSYADLSGIIGRDVQNGARGALNTARRMCEREDDKTFGVVTNEGLKCLNGQEVISTAEFSIGHIRRTSRKALKRLRCVGDMKQLGNDDIIKLNTSASVLGAFQVMTKDSSVKKISAHVSKSQEQLPYAKTLDAFK